MIKQDNNMHCVQHDFAMGFMLTFCQIIMYLTNYVL